MLKIYAVFFIRNSQQNVLKHIDFIIDDFQRSHDKINEKKIGSIFFLLQDTFRIDLNL